MPELTSAPSSLDDGQANAPAVRLPRGRRRPSPRRTTAVADGSPQVLVLWADDRSANLGVRALGAGVAALVERAWPDAQVAYLHHGGAAPVKLGDQRGLAAELVVPRKGWVEWLRQFDVVVDTRSGDSFADIYGLGRHLSMGLVAEAVRRARRPYVLAPQTIGAFGTRRGRVLARRTLAIADLTMARDSASAQVAAGLGRPVDVLTTDVVFALGQPVPDGTRDVLLNISGLLWQPGPHVDHRRYREAVTAVYRDLRGAGREVGLLAHVLPTPGHRLLDDDLPAVQAFAEHVGHDGEIITPTSLDHVRSVIASADLVVGSRMHACLNALSVGTATVPLAYSGKFAPLLHDLGWPGSIDLRHERDVRARFREVEAGVRTADAERARATAQSLVERAVDALRSVA